jgi:hypothetical protein
MIPPVIFLAFVIHYLLVFLILFCNIQNQNNQDCKIYRMLLDDFWWGVGDFILSESGCPGFEDLQDVIG